MQIVVVKNYKARYPELKGRALTDRLILDLLGEEAQVVRSDEGKPSICWEKNQTPPFVSVSHCEDYFACVFDGENIGIDIQNERQVNIEKISRRYYAPAEQDFAADDPERFFTVWARKEAFAKYTGRGIAQINRSVDVFGRNDVGFWDITMLGDYHLCVCISRDRAEKEDYEIQFLD